MGYGPKTLQRVLRFRRFVSRIDALAGTAGTADLAGIAAEAGYADQAHLTRESTRLASLPRPRWPEPALTAPVPVTTRLTRLEPNGCGPMGSTAFPWPRVTPSGELRRPARRDR